MPGGPFLLGARRRTLRLRQRAPAPRGRHAALPHRPHAGHQRDLADLHRGRRLPAPRVVVGRGLVVEGGLRHHPPGEWAAGPTGGGSGAWTAGRRCTPTSRWSTSPGSRRTPSPAPSELGSRPSRSGRRRRPGTRSEALAALSLGRAPAPATAAPTSTRRASARSRSARCPPAPRPAARSGCSATRGSGPRRAFHGYPGFTPYPYREYSEVFFGAGYRVLRGGSWATRSARGDARRSATGTCPQRRQIFSGFRLA